MRHPDILPASSSAPTRTTKDPALLLHEAEEALGTNHELAGERASTVLTQCTDVSEDMMQRARTILKTVQNSVLLRAARKAAAEKKIVQRDPLTEEPSNPSPYATHPDALVTKDADFDALLQAKLLEIGKRSKVFAPSLIPDSERSQQDIPPEKTEKAAAPVKPSDFFSLCAQTPNVQRFIHKFPEWLPEALNAVGRREGQAKESAIRSLVQKCTEAIRDGDMLFTQGCQLLDVLLAQKIFRSFDETTKYREKMRPRD